MENGLSKFPSRSITVNAQAKVMGLDHSLSHSDAVGKVMVLSITFPSSSTALSIWVKVITLDHSAILPSSSTILNVQAKVMILDHPVIQKMRL